MTPLPRSCQDWIVEIRAALADAVQTIPFGPLVGVEITPSDLFHLAPVAALKARDLAPNKKNIKRATEAALSSYVATTSENPGLRRLPTVLFAFAYLASHYGLDLVSEAQVNQVMAFITDNPGSLLLAAPRSNSRSRRLVGSSVATKERQNHVSAVPPKQRSRKKKNAT